MARDTIDTVKRVISGDFADASPEEREAMKADILKDF